MKIPSRMNGFGAITTLALLLSSGTAQALLISPTGNTTGNPAQATYQVNINPADVGDSFTLNWRVPKGSGTDGLPVDLTARGDFKITKFDLNGSGLDSLGLKLRLYNTTDLSGYPDANAAIYSFGFGVEERVYAKSAIASLFTGLGSGSGPQRTFPGGFKDIDVCAYAGDQCSGGNVNEGLQAGGWTDWKVFLDGDFDQGGNSSASVTLNDFPLKFQGTWGSFEVPGQPDSHQVPTSGSLALFAGGLLGLRMVARRRCRVR